MVDRLISFYKVTSLKGWMETFTTDMSTQPYGSYASIYRH